MILLTIILQNILLKYIVKIYILSNNLKILSFPALCAKV